MCILPRVISQFRRLVMKLLNQLTHFWDWIMDFHARKHHRVLFILKRRHDYAPEYGANHLATGMYNSAKFVSDMLEDAGIDSKVVIVVDNNCIDREVTKYKATHVFIEGIWVVPEKFDVLKRLHPRVKWIIRCHSELPFLAQEGNAIDWIFEYTKRGISVSGNSPRVNDALQHLVGDALGIHRHCLDHQMPLLPNYYPIDRDDFKNGCEHRHLPKAGVFDIGCFGAIRPLKNQLIQAVAAVEFAKRHRCGLRFHINAGRVEQNGSNQLKNLRALFKQLGKGFELVEHPWMEHHAFKRLLRKMDVAMQVSMSETFNIVTADAISVGTPTVVSSELIWASPQTYAEKTSVDSIVETLEHVWHCRSAVVDVSFDALENYSEHSRHLWLKYLRD